MTDKKPTQLQKKQIELDFAVNYLARISNTAVAFNLRLDTRWYYTIVKYCLDGVMCEEMPPTLAAFDKWEILYEICPEHLLPRFDELLDVWKKAVCKDPDAPEPTNNPDLGEDEDMYHMYPHAMAIPV